MAKSEPVVVTTHWLRGYKAGGTAFRCARCGRIFKVGDVVIRRRSSSRWYSSGTVSKTYHSDC